MKNLEKELAKMAMQKGICKEWHAQLTRTKDKDALVEMYVRGIDFCLSNDYPGNDFIREHFKGTMEKHGVFIDDVIGVKNNRRCVLLGACSGRVSVDGYNVSEIFLKDNTAVSLEVSGNAFVVVDMFDNSQLDICVRGNGKVCINHYGGQIVRRSASAAATIKINEKNKPTY